MYKFTNIISASLSLLFMAVVVFLFFYAAILVLPFIIIFIAAAAAINFFNAKDTSTQNKTTYKKVYNKNNEIIDAEYEVIDDK